MKSSILIVCVAGVVASLMFAAVQDATTFTSKQFLRKLAIVMPQTVQLKENFRLPAMHVPSSPGPDYMNFLCGPQTVWGQDIHDSCSAPTPDHVMPMASIVQVYNHAKSAGDVIKGLTSQSNMARILVYEDNSTDGSFEAYQEAIQNVSNAEIIRGWNVHEIRNYNKGMDGLLKWAPNIELFALMQDDDVLNNLDDDWGRRASDIFQRHPNLCVLGGYVGWTQLHGGKLQGIEWYGNEPSYNPRNKKVQIAQRCGDSRFRFVAAIASSPMILRRSCVEDIGLLSEMTTAPGDPGILFDVEYSLRAWNSNNWTVGLYETGFSHGVGGHSTLKGKEKRQKRIQAGHNARHFLVENHNGANLNCRYQHWSPQATKED